MSNTTNLSLQIIDPSDYVDPEPINENMRKIDQTGLRYVVEKSSNRNPRNTWVWNKYSDGTCEMWLSWFTTLNINTAWGGVYRSNATNSHALPFTLAAPPAIVRTLSNAARGTSESTSPDNGDACWVVQLGAATTTKTGTSLVCNGENIGTIAARLNDYVFGIWK